MNKVAIYSVPRSGSSWLGSILDSSPNTLYRYQPLFSYTHKGQLDTKSSLEDINSFFEDISKTEDEFVLQYEAVKKNLVPLFPKTKPTHIVYKEVRYLHILENLLLKDNDVKVIGLVRSPFAVINSWLQAPKEFKKELGWKVEEEWKFAPSKNLNKQEEFNGFEKWKESIFLFLKLLQDYPNQFFLVNYDDLLSDRENAIKKIFKFCDLPYTKQTQDFLEESSNQNKLDAYSVFKFKKDDKSWKQSLPDFITEAIKSDKEYISLNDKFKWNI